MARGEVKGECVRLILPDGFNEAGALSVNRVMWLGELLDVGEFFDMGVVNARIVNYSVTVFGCRAQ